MWTFQVASLCLLAWAALAEIDPGPRAQLRDPIGEQMEKKLTHAPSQIYSDNTHLPKEDYRSILTQKTMDLLSEAVAMLNHVRDNESKRWLDDFVLKIGHLALKIEENNKIRETVDKFNGIHRVNQNRNKGRYELNKAGDPKHQKYNVVKQFNHEDVQKDANEYNYFSKLNSDNTFSQASTRPKRNPKAGRKQGENLPSHNLNSQVSSNLVFYTPHQRNRTHNKQSPKKKEYFASLNHSHKSLGKSHHENKSSSIPERFSFFSPPHNKLHRRAHGKENSHESLHYRNDLTLLQDAPTGSQEPSPEPATKGSTSTSFAEAGPNGARNETSKQKEGPSKSIHEPFTIYHNHHHRSHSTNKIRSNNLLKKGIRQQHSLPSNDKFRNIEEQLKAGKVLILSDSVVRSNFAKSSDKPRKL